MSIRIFSITVVLVCLAIDGMNASAHAESTVDEKAGGLVLHLPSSWKKEQPKSRMRLMQFSVPAMEGDKENAELSVFSFPGGGSVPQNIKRWIDQFAPANREVSLFQGKTKEGQYVLADISGTYKKPIGPPIAGRTKEVPGSRVLAVILTGPEGPEGKVYYLKLVGPDKTVAAESQRLRAAFDGDVAEEKPFSLGQ
jgi:gluconolactonase